MPRPKVIVSGILFWYPLAGVTYQFLHYLIGLRRAGYEPYYIEDSDRWGVYDPATNNITTDPSTNISTVSAILEGHGFGDCWAFRTRVPELRTFGLSDTAVRALYTDAEAFLNVTGAQEIRDEQLQCRNRIYVQSDPFAIQAAVAQGDPAAITMLEAHDILFTFGENIGFADCSVPIGKFTWHPTRQPVVTDLWPIRDLEAGATYNTITTWRNIGKDFEFEGQTWYWTKDREFLKFIQLPRLRPCVPFELASSVDAPTRELLVSNTWRNRSSLDISRDPISYRDYIAGAKGEFTVARDQYVRPRTGWFSDRTACYLAAGRPAVTQETGFSKFLPTREGLFAFTTMDDILTAVDAIEADPARHCRAAREIASEYFEAEVVVRSMMQRAGVH